MLPQIQIAFSLDSQTVILCYILFRIFFLVFNSASYTLNYKCHNEEPASIKIEDKIICTPHVFSPA